MSTTAARPERVIVLEFPDWPEEEDFAPVFRGLTELVPQIELLRHGVVAMRARGPARYYGSEDQAASALLAFARDTGHEGGRRVRIGIADGRFAAEQAAKQAVEQAVGQFAGADTGTGTGAGADPPVDSPAESVRIVPPGESAAFLAPLPVDRCADEDFAMLLTGLGMYTLGDFAALPEPAVLARFGTQGVRAHRHARGEDGDRDDEIRPQQAARDFEMGLDFEPPLENAEQLAFACSTLAQRFFDALSEDRFVCTSLRVTLTDDVGARHERDWSHPRFFTTADIVARIRWQLGSMSGGPAATQGGARPGGAAFGDAVDRAGAGVSAVRISPARVDRLAGHEPGLWTTGPDERVHHHLSRAQGLLGPAGVGTATLEGGRLLLERQRFTPWGTTPRRERAPGPWPGALPAPQPSLVFSPPLRALLLGASGAAVDIDADDLLTEPPTALRVEGHDLSEPVTGWSKPWPLREHWWEGRRARFRLQLELANGDAWVLLGQAGRSGERAWFAEGRYD